MSTAYTGNLISVMTYPGMENPINNADGILDSGYDIDIRHYGGIETSFFEATQNPSFKQIWEAKTLVKSNRPSMENVLKGKTVFVAVLSSLIPYSKSKRQGTERVHIGKTPFFPFYSSWAYQPNAIFSEVLDQTLLHIISFGFPQYWLNQATIELKELNPMKEIAEDMEPQFTGLTLENLQVHSEEKILD